MKMKRAIWTILTATVLSSACSIIFNKPVDIKVNAESGVSTPSFTGETELASNDLLFKVSSSTTTESSQRYTLTFLTQFTGYLNQLQQIAVSVDDVRFDEEKAFEYEGETFEGYVSKWQASTKNYTTAVIPALMSYGTFFDIEVIYIPENFATGDYGKVTDIVIPKQITYVDANAFTNVPNEVTIHCEATSKPTNWEDGWTDATNVEWGYTPTAEDKKAIVCQYFTSIDIKTGRRFILGSKPIAGDTHDYFLYIEYNIVENGVTTTATQQVDINTDNGSTFYSVGISTNKTEIPFSIYKTKTQTIDDSSIVIHNIYDVKEERSPSGGVTYLPDVDKGAKYIVPQNYPAEKTDLSSILTYKTDKLSSFANFISVNILIDKNLDAYKTLKPESYAKHKADIEKGKVIIRYRFTRLGVAKYFVTFENDKKELETCAVKISSPVQYIIVESDKNFSCGFLLDTTKFDKPISFSSIKQVELRDFNFDVEAILDGSNKPADPDSTISISFGGIQLITNGREAVSNIDTLVVLGITYGVSIVLYAVVCICLFFYFKNKYKNDEFKRLKPKSFIKSCIKNFIGYIIVVSSLIFIVIRCAFLNNAVVLYNPVDVYVSIFTVAAGIYIGFTIKNIVVYIKNERANKKKQKLKIDQDVVEDGTN